jgi:hypothetical protein
VPILLSFGEPYQPTVNVIELPGGRRGFEAITVHGGVAVKHA